MRPPCAHAAGEGNGRGCRAHDSICAARRGSGRARGTGSCTPRAHTRTCRRRQQHISSRARHQRTASLERLVWAPRLIFIVAPRSTAYGASAQSMRGLRPVWIGGAGMLVGWRTAPSKARQKTNNASAATSRLGKSGCSDSAHGRTQAVWCGAAPAAYQQRRVRHEGAQRVGWGEQ